jgi:hypothetical protein
MLKVLTILVKDAPKINIERGRGGGFGLKAYFALNRLSLKRTIKTCENFGLSQGLLSRIVEVKEFSKDPPMAMCPNRS